MLVSFLLSVSFSSSCNKIINIHNSPFPTYYEFHIEPEEQICLNQNGIPRVALIMQEWTYGNFQYDNNGSISETYLYPIAGGYYSGISSNGRFLISVTQSSTIKFSTSVVNESCSNLIISNLNYDTFSLDSDYLITNTPDFFISESKLYCYINHNPLSQSYRMHYNIQTYVNVLRVNNQYMDYKDHYGRDYSYLMTSAKSPLFISYKSTNYQKASYIGIEISNAENKYNYGASGSFSAISDHSPIGYNFSNTIRFPTYTHSGSSYNGNSSNGQNGSFIYNYYLIGAILLLLNIIILCIYPNRMYHIGLNYCCCNCCCCCCSDSMDRYSSYYSSHNKNYCCCCCEGSDCRISSGNNLEGGCVLFIFLLIFFVVFFPIMMLYVFIILLITDESERNMEKSSFKGKRQCNNNINSNKNSTTKSLVPDVPSYSPAAPNMYGQAIPQAPYPSPQYGVPMSPQPYQQYPVPNGPYPPPNVQYQIPNAQYPNAPPQYQVGPTNQPNQIAPPL